MPITFSCGACGAKLTAPDNYAGRVATCLKCKERVKVPAGNPSPITTPRSDWRANAVKRLTPILKNYWSAIRELTKSSPRMDGLSGWAWLLIVAGAAAFLFFAFGYDTTIESPTTYVPGVGTIGGDRVYNIGLQQNRLIGCIFGMVSMVVGGALLAIDRNNRKPKGEGEGASPARTGSRNIPTLLSALIVGVSVFLAGSFVMEKATTYHAEIKTSATEAREALDAKNASDVAAIQTLERYMNVHVLNNHQMAEAIVIIRNLEKVYGKLGLTVDVTAGKIIGAKGALDKVKEPIIAKATIALDEELKQLLENQSKIEEEKQSILTRWRWKTCINTALTMLALGAAVAVFVGVSWRHRMGLRN